MRPLMREVIEMHGVDALVCLGGDGTVRNALRLEEEGIKVLTLPKTIDNDVMGTDVTFGFDTAVNIANRGDRPTSFDRPLPPPHHGRRIDG